ncbi:MAG: hypothetical protein KJ046_16820 [Anaerolineae bacterium]|nr:hypothetical protein [Anaerolineae bacterium]
MSAQDTKYEIRDTNRAAVVAGDPVTSDEGDSCRPTSDEFRNAAVVGVDLRVDLRVDPVTNDE